MLKHLFCKYRQNIALGAFILSAIHISREHGGLQLPAISTRFNKLNVSRMAQLIASRDNCVHFVASRMSQHEDATSCRALFPASIMSSIMCDDLGMSKKNLKVSAKCSNTASNESSKFQQLKALQVQGECFQSDAGSSDIWSMTTQSVPGAMNVSTNIFFDTVLHRRNLIKWGKAQHALCVMESKLCYMF